jgi:hypothetical protein
MVHPILSRPLRRRYIGNADTTEAHDLTKEAKNCRVDEIIAAGNAVAFYPDSLVEAHADGYDDCAWCVGASARMIRASK